MMTSTSWIQQLGYCLLLLFGWQLAQASELLRPEQAFVFDARNINSKQVALTWQIAPQHYLYRAQIQVQDQQQQPLVLELPEGQIEEDAYFGRSEVYYDQLILQTQLQPEQRYSVFYQGCAKDRICYPIQRVEIETDAWGQIRPDANSGKKFIASADTTTRSALPRLTESGLSTGAADTTSTPSTASNSATTSWLNDQHWLNQLTEQSLLLRVLTFFALGLLLAFTPCNLPMIPILSSVIARGQAKGKAAIMGLIFVLSMALVYALMGWVAASLGFNLQRWLQHPLSLMLISGLFIVFAFNLFGFYELRLPQHWLTRLDRWQGQQRRGSFIGAGVMGALSALLVGPCMTAPLAAALLFIAQSQAHFEGVIWLFSLGLGMGLPLVLVILFGRHLLPESGTWMYQVKAILGWMMLAAALYLSRPLLSHTVFLICVVLFVLACISYLIWQLLQAYRLRLGRAMWVYVAMIAVLVPLSVMLIQPLWQQRQHSSQTLQTWQRVTTLEEWQAVQRMSQYNHQDIVMDVYADWCVTCQPIEHRILPDPEVQAALAGKVLVRLDLSEYTAEQEALIQQLEILGPPSFLFFSPDGQEQRARRLTGIMNKSQLLAALAAG